jgi:tripartite-type tricarboxylate transporter receptor subunit TctC
MKRRTFLRGAAAAAAASVAVPGISRAQAAWPTRPVRVIVPWGAGGGTDYHARTIASLLEAKLGTSFPALQRTGGSGVVGHTAIASADKDGYTIGAVTVEIAMMHWQGLTPLTVKDFAPIALLNRIPAGINVAANSQWQTLEQLVAHIRANPGRLKSSGTGQGGIWHLAIAGLLESLGIAPDAAPWIPSEGSAAGLQELVAGGVDIVPCPAAEAAALIDAGRVRCLGVMSPDRLPRFPTVPTVAEAVGSSWTCASFISLMGPAGMPQVAVDRLAAAVAEIMAGPEWAAAMEARGFGINHMGPAELGAFAAAQDESLGRVMRSLGIART